MLQEDEMVGRFVRDELVILLTGERVRRLHSSLAYEEKKKIGEESTVS